MEKETNNSLAQAQTVAAPCTIVGQIAVEGMDYFKVHAEVRAAYLRGFLRLRKDPRFAEDSDPMLTLYDAEGRELVAMTTSTLPIRCWPRGGRRLFPTTRDSKYDGDRRW